MNDDSNGFGTNPQSNETGFSEEQKDGLSFISAKLKLDMTESGQDTIRRTLAGYEIGKKLRRLRMQKKIGLVDLGKHTGLSASMLSQLENDKLVPTLPTLARIAMVFDVGVEHFFSNRRKKKLFSITRAKERIRFPERADVPAPSFFFECLAFSVQDKSLQAYEAQFPKSDEGMVHEHFHEGAELLYILEGKIEVSYEDETHLLREGDCVYFDSSEPHSYRGVSKQAARAIVITTGARV